MSSSAAPFSTLSSSHRASSHRAAAILLGVVSFFSFIYFYEGGGWNQNSRFDLLRAIVERHTLQIDPYHQNTQDKAHFRGHYYSDKAPGQVFLAVPVAVIARPALQRLGVEPESPRGEVAVSYIVTAGAVALPAALAGVCLFFAGLRFAGDANAAAFGTIVMCLGTPFWAYASLFWAHALVGACLIFAFAAALKIATLPAENAGRMGLPAVGIRHPARAQFCWALAVGLAAGWATVTEYPAAPASAFLALLALSQSWGGGKPARWRVAAGIGLGAAICVAVLLGYLHAAFGGFRPSYSYYDPQSFSFMQKQGFLGLTYPHPDRLLKIMFGCSRGLFFASPVLLAAPLGMWWLWKEKNSRAAALTAGGITLYYFLFNASFYWWKAGLSFGPRYAGASIPLLCVGLAIAWGRAGRSWRRVLIIALVASVFVALMVVSTTSQLAMQDSCPLAHSTWPEFWSGHMAMNHDSMLTVSEAGAGGGHAAFNLGQLMGLHGLASLVPLLAMWAIALAVWVWIQRDQNFEASHRS